MSKFPAWGVGLDVSADNLAYMIPNNVIKASASTYTSNTTLANDSELVNIALEAGTWEVELLILATGVASGAGNLKVGWTFSGTLTGTPKRACLGPGAASTAVPSAVVNTSYAAVDYSAAQVYGLGSTTVYHAIQEIAPNFVVSVAGNLTVQFAQGTSSGTSTVVQAGTRLRCRRIV